MRRTTICAMLVCCCSMSLAEEPSDKEEVRRWTFAEDTDGWKPVRHCELSVSRGTLKFVSTGNDPHLTAQISAPAGWKEFSFRAKFQGRADGQVFWTTTKDSGTSEQRSVRTSIRSRDLEWHTYRVYFKSEAELTSIRFDPNNRKGRIEMQWIALANRQPPPPQATPVEQLKLLPGFKAELLYSVPSIEQGSWVAMTPDDKGRLITSDQYGKLYRVTPPAIGSDEKINIERIEVNIGMAQGLLYAFDSLYVMVSGGADGLYRVRDTDGDDKFDDVKLLRKLEGGGEHGPHAIVLSPDKKSIYVCAGNHTKLTEIQKSRVPENWQEDILHDRMWDAGGHAVGKMAPGGWICKVDPDGKEFELVSMGYRNQYDIAFNAEGELFTYDADMEWDVGSPWYRPTRVLHATSGSEFGWRSGTGKWPTYYPDSLPSVVDIGPGSPTGIVFGTGAKFPAKYQQALFIADWSYGVIYAVHMKPDGASYTGATERFVSAAPLPVTDMIVMDGALYFTIGGRRTQSGLYRVTYAGDKSTAPPKPTDDFVGLRKLRRELESLHREVDGAVDKAWPHLSHADRHIRYAARIAIEHQPVESWQDKALAEKNPVGLMTAIVALARNGDRSLQPKIVDALATLDWESLTESQQLDLLRAHGLVLLRLGEPVNKADVILKQMDEHYPAASQSLNRELCQLLAYLEAPGVTLRTLELMKKAPTQEEQIYYALMLRKVKSDWTIDERKEFFSWFNQAAAHRGGHSFSGFLRNIRNEAIASLTDKEKLALADVLKAEPQPINPAELEKRPFVKKWAVADLLPDVEAGLQGRDFDRGRKMFAATTCFRCHRFGGEGGTVGPDLSAVGTRFNSRDLLESLIEPDKTISDQYASTMFQMEDGRAITGRVVNLNNKTLMVLTDMLDPGNLTPINRDEIVASKPSTTSQMPSGLLDTLSEEEILDLLAYLRSGGNPKHDSFK